MKISDYIAKFLKKKEVDLVFVITGAGNIRLIESIKNEGIDYVCMHHEQALVMSAIARHRVNNRPAVCLVTGGPGAANTVIGLADAYLDSIPCLIIAGQEKQEYVRNPKKQTRGLGVQGLNMVEITNSITKYSVCLDEARNIGLVLEKAFYHMNNNRPGPVWIEIPQDLQWSPVDQKLVKFKQPKKHSISLKLKKDFSQVLSLLNKAERPIIWVGHGVRLANCIDSARLLLSLLKIPILSSWQAADIITDDNPFFVGRAGTYGQRGANLALQNCDLLITLGTRLAIPQRGYNDKEFARFAKKVIVEIDPNELSKYKFKIDIPILANVADFIDVAISEIKNKKFYSKDYNVWLKKCNAWNQKYPMSQPPRNEKDGINSYWFIDRLSAHLKPSDIIITDMGTSLTCTHAAIKLKKGQRLITSTGLGEMGFGLPAAIGAALGKKKKSNVILICGEGSLMMNLQELQTLDHLKLSIKIFLLNNNGYLTIKHTHNALYDSKGKASATDPKSGVSFPNFSKISNAFNISYKKIKTSKMLNKWIEEILEKSESVIGEIQMPEFQELIPKIALKVDDDGKIYSPPLEDMYPFLSEEELKSEMIVPLLKK